MVNKMTSLSILWTLLFLATVRARSEVSITDAALDTENSWSGVPVSDDEENSLKTDVNSQNSADIEDAILSRIGLDALAQSVGNSKLSDSDGVELEKALDDKLQDISDTLSRLSGIEPNEISDTNYDNLANLKISKADSDEVYKHQHNLKNDNVLSILDSGANGVSVWSDPNRDDRLNVVSRNGHNLNPLSSLHSRSSKLWPLIPGYNKWNINEKDGRSYTDQNVDSDVLLKRIAALNDLKGRKSNNFNNLLLAKNTGQNTVLRRNDLLDISKVGSGRPLINTPWLSKNDLENVKISADHGIATIDEIISNRRSLVNSDKVNRNSENLNTLKRLALNNLEPNVLDERNLNSDIDAELANIVNVRAGSNEMNELNKISSLDDNSNDVNVLDHLSKHGIRTNRHGISKVGLNDLNQVKNALKILESNKLNTKTGSIDVDRELASIIANVRAGGNALNELNKINTLYDDSNDVNVIDHLSKHGLVTNKNGIKKVSLNDLNDAKRLLGPLSVDRVTIADRVSNEVDGALLNALNTEDNFNALGALFVLNKASETSEKLNSLGLKKINGRSDIDIESNLLSKLGAPENSAIDGITGNPLKEVLNSLAVLSKIDSTNGVESGVHLEYSPENLSRSHKKLLHNLVASKLDTKLENKVPETEVDDVDSLLSRVSGSLSKKKLRKLLNEPKRTHKQYKGYRPSSQYNDLSYLHQSRLNSGLDKNENLSDLVELSKIATLSKINDNIPIISVRGEENEYSLDDLLSALDKNAVSDVSSDLSKSQLKNLIALRNHALDHVHGENHLNHVSDVDEEKSVRLAVSKLDKDLRDAKNLILTGGLGNLKDQRRMISGKSNLKLLSGEEENKYDNVVLVPVRVDSGAVAKRAVGPYDISDLIDLDEIN